MAGDLDRDPRVRLVTVGFEPLDPPAVLAAVGDRAGGGNVLFVGTVRDVTGAVATARLEYEAHPPLALAEFARLCREAADRFGLIAVAVSHRLGVVEPGDASVAVAASAAHRRQAFAAAEWLMEQIKATVPIWKCDHAPDGGRTWVHGDRTAVTRPAAQEKPPGAIRGDDTSHP
ncbi:MAG: molybdenum cofactor biosynthesis protein MoaE [Planctomycetota bacterium]